MTHPIFRQLFDRETSTYTYLIADPATRKAALIDPVREQMERDIALLEDLDLKLEYVLETHVHADHVTSAGILRQRLGAKTVLSAASGSECATDLVDDGDVIHVGEVEIEARHTPGHTAGCATFVLRDGDETMAFTGDALMIRGCGRTDFQQGDARQLYDSVWTRIFSLPDTTAIYPGHDYHGRTRSSVAEEKRLNPRLGAGRTRAEFVQIMEGLGLAYPKQIDVAVPANMHCGLTQDGSSPKAAWADVARTDDGVPEVSPEWVRQRLGEVALLDVRRPDELRGPLGAIEGARNIPLDRLPGALGTLDPDAPLVVFCRSGGRSGSAARLLEGAGFTQVASMHGGMTRWNALGISAPGDAASCG